MADKTTLNRAFNTHFFEFLEDIIAIYPDNDDITSSHAAFTTIRRANPTALVKAWNSYVYAPYRGQIDAGDIEFFFQKDYSSDLGGVRNGNEIIKIIDKIRGPVQSMDETNRQHCMTYIQNLSRISDAYSKL
jgi:hypothetical protein